jgi:hypothetical protein
MLLPERPEIRSLAGAARATFERIGATVRLAHLDAALASAVPAPAVAATASAEVTAE